MKTVEIKEPKKDNTKELRDAVNLEVNELQIISDEPIFVTGKLEGDNGTIDKGSQGGYGILRIEGKDNYKLRGKSKEEPTVIFTTEPAVSKVSDDNVSGGNMSQRKYLRIEEDVYGFEASDLTFRGNNTKPKDKPYFPAYESQFEFEHGIQNRGSNVTLRNIRSEGIWGDGFYGGGGNNVKLINCSAYAVGRQGGAITAGTNYLIKNFDTYSRRSDFDIEANHVDAIIDNVFIIGGKSYAWLSGIPMGGKGQVSNILIRDRDFLWGNSINVLGSHKNGYGRKKIIIDGCKFRMATKGPMGPFKFTDTEDVLIENITECELSTRRTQIIAKVKGECKNITIRNSDFKNAKYISLEGNTKPEQVKVYGVVQDLEFLYPDGRTEPVVQVQGDSDKIPFAVSEELYKAYHYADYGEDQDAGEPVKHPIGPPIPKNWPQPSKIDIVEVGEDFVSLSFESEGATSYRYHKRNEGGHNRNATVTEGFIKETKVSKGLTYTFRVWAINEHGEMELPAITYIHGETKADEVEVEEPLNRDMETDASTNPPSEVVENETEESVDNPNKLVLEINSKEEALTAMGKIVEYLKK